MLQGQAAGVQVQGSGEPGGYVQIKIRGISTFGNNSPLFVVDGVALDGPFDFSPGDIESMQVLKDASSAALYGARAAQGVVIITTKKGKAGPLKLNYNGYYGWQNIAKRIDVTDRVGYQKITSAAELNAGLSIAPGNDPNSPAYISNVNTDWQKEALKTGNIQDHNLTMSGGSEAVSYNLSLGYFDQNGTITGPQKYDRYSVNSNMQGKKGRFTYGAKIAYTQSNKNNYGLTTDHAVFGGNVTSILAAIPTMPVYDPKRLGGYGGSDNVTQRAITLNVVGMNALTTDYSNRNRFLGNVWGELEIIKNLKFRTSASYDRLEYKDFHFEPMFDLGFYYLNTQFNMRQTNGKDNTGQWENQLTYALKAGKHKVDFLVGTSYLERHYENLYASAKDTGDLPFRSFANVAPSAIGASSYFSANTLLGYLGRVNYNFDDRYLLSGNFRRDGSSRFGPANKYGNFASVAAAWNLSNEKFIKLPDYVSSVKLRGGYGELGNQNIGDYLFQSFINPNASYVFGDVLATGATTVAKVDPNIKWESTSTFNVAADLGFLNNRLLFTAEYYNRESSGLLVGVPLPPSSGSIPLSLVTNAASTRNTGMEFTLSYNKSVGDFQYNVNANFSTLKNKVLELGGTGNPIYGAGSKTEVGRSVGELFGFITEGIFQSAAEVASHATQTNAAPGDIKFKDVNGFGTDGKLTGQPDGQITDADRVYLGTTIPKYFYGLNLGASYKNFDISLFFQGSAGNKVFNGVRHDLLVGQYINHSTEELNFWTPTNTNTNIPRPIIGDPNGNSRFSDRFVESGSYLKLQNAQIGYNLPASIANKTRVFKTLRAYVSGQNILTISKYWGYDPDFISDGLFSRGYDYGSFPNPRTVMVGLQLGL
jgi:TonB-linked SusC/RagA family outer membrane protein